MIFTDFYTSVYNPGVQTVRVKTYKYTVERVRVNYVLAVHAKSWKLCYWTDDVAAKVELGELICFNTPSSGSGSFDGVKEMYEDYIVLTAQDIINGYFETEKQVAPYHWDSTEFVPADGIQQIYPNDYTCYNINTTTRVIFNSTVPNGPSEGLQSILTAGDEISFRYIPS